MMTAPTAALARGGDPPEPSGVLAPRGDPPESPGVPALGGTVPAGGRDGPGPAAVLVRGGDPPEPPARPDTSGSRLGRATLAVLTLALSLIAGLSFDGAFSVGGIWPMCLICAAAPALVAAGALLPRRRPLPLLLTVAASAFIWLAVVPLLARAFAAPQAPLSHASLVLILRTALTDAPKQLLTTAPPVTPDAALLAALGTLVWWASAWSAESVVRGGAPLRSVLPPALVLLAGTASGVPAGSASQLWPSAIFLAIVAALLAAERALRRRRSAVVGESRWRAAGGLAVVVGGPVLLVTAVAVISTPLLPGLASRPPADPRQLVRPPSHVQSLIDPLSLVTAWLAGRPRPLFTVRTTDPVNLRWLVLDRYDGQEWTSDASYLPAGTRLPGGGPGARKVRSVSDVMQVLGLPGTWLPAPERPVGVAGIAVRVDPASGVLATLDGTSASRLSYQVTSAIGEPSLGELVNAVPASGPAVAGQTSLPPGLPPAITKYGNAVVSGAAYPFQQMVRLQDALLQGFRYDPRGIPGESYGSLAYFLSRRTGGPAQFATLFAVLARHAGFPCRIAIGFLPGRQIRPGLYQVTTTDALVWPEVYFTGLGWLPFYPLPQPGSHANALEVRALGQPAGLSYLEQRVARARAPVRPQTSPAPILLPKAAGHRAPVNVGRIVTWALLILLGAGASYLAGAAGWRWSVRRRWRRDPDPRRRVAGAWRDALGWLAAADAGPVSFLTADEIIERATIAAGPSAREPVGALAALAGAALFSSRPPSPADADAAWSAASRLRSLSRRRTRWRRRAIWLLRPVPPRFAVDQRS